MASDAGAKQIEINNFEPVGNRSAASPPPPLFRPIRLKIRSKFVLPSSLPPHPQNEQKQSRRGRGTSSRGFHARPMPRVQRALISDVIVSPSGQSTHVFQDKRADQSLPSFLRASIANLLCRQFLFSQRDESMVYHVVYIYIYWYAVFPSRRSAEIPRRYYSCSR